MFSYLKNICFHTFKIKVAEHLAPVALVPMPLFSRLLPSANATATFSRNSKCQICDNDVSIERVLNIHNISAANVKYMVKRISFLAKHNCSQMLPD